MRKQLITMCIFALTLSFAIKPNETFAQKGGTPKSWGIGLRLGDPSGLTIKKYFGGNKAIEFNVGRTNVWGSTSRYDERFANYYYDKYYDINNDYYRDWKGKDWKYYRGYFGSNYAFRAYSFQFHYLIHNDIKALSGLRWYFGFGPQIKLLHYSFSYFDGFGRPISDSYVSANVGVDGVIGAEYTFAKVPLSVFVDAGLYMEIVREPFYIQGLIGTGVRFNF